MWSIDFDAQRIFLIIKETIGLDSILKMKDTMGILNHSYVILEL